MIQLREAPEVPSVADAARIAGPLALDLRDAETAAVLLGAFGHVLAGAGISLANDVAWLAAHDRMVEQLAAVLGTEAFVQARSSGEQLTPDEVLELAISVANRLPS